MFLCHECLRETDGWPGKNFIKIAGDDIVIPDDVTDDLPLEESAL